MEPHYHLSTIHLWNRPSSNIFFSLFHHLSLTSHSLFSKKEDWKTGLCNMPKKPRKFFGDDAEKIFLYHFLWLCQPTERFKGQWSMLPKWADGLTWPWRESNQASQVFGIVRLGLPFLLGRTAQQGVRQVQLTRWALQCQLRAALPESNWQGSWTRNSFAKWSCGVSKILQNPTGSPPIIYRIQRVIIGAVTGDKQKADYGF
jgi:hypothetical protein